MESSFTLSLLRVDFRLTSENNLRIWEILAPIHQKLYQARL
jgi:hypothetical protein